MTCASECFRVAEFDLGFSDEGSIRFEAGRMRAHLAAGKLAYDEERPGFRHRDPGVLTFCVHKKDLAIAEFATIVTTMHGH